MVLWGIPFYLQLSPMPETPWDNRDRLRLMRRGMTQVYQTLDDEGRKVKSHVLKFTYPK